MKSLISILLIFSFTVFMSASVSYGATVGQVLAPQSKIDNTLGIKIISPPHDKKVPAGNLTILGTSTDNESMNCTVYVDWNNLKPFQKAIATGPYGKNDYSSWTFIYTPSYHKITNGTNNLTSKLECQKGGTVTSKWNSINVTGIESATFVQPISKSINNYVGNNKILPQLSSQVNKVMTRESSGMTVKTLTPVPATVMHSLLTNIRLAKPVVSPGDSKSIIVKAVDAKSFKQISGANVQIRMTDGVRNIEHPGVTNSNGLYNYTWTIDPTSKLGAYKIASNVSILGYTPSVHEANFQVQGQLLVQVNLAKGIVNPGDSQSIIVKAVDAKSFKQISGANVQIRMTDGVRNIEHPGVTNSNGLYNYTWTIDPTSKLGAYKIASNVSILGYTPSVHEANFQVQGQLLVQVNLAKGIVNPGDSQSIIVKAVDAKSFKQISGANVQIRMTDGVRNIEHPGVTNSNGLYNYTWTIDPTSKLGAYKIASNVSILGYTPSVHEANFQVQGQLLVQVNLAKGIVNPGDSQSIIVKAVDAKSFKQISGANVQIRMTDGVRNIEHPGVTNSNGLYNYTW